MHREQVMQSEAMSAQARVQENLRANIHISQALLDKTSAAAANLHAMIDEAMSRYRDPAGLGGLLGPYSSWTVSALLFSIISAMNPRAALAMLLIGSSECTFFHSAGRPNPA